MDRWVSARRRVRGDAQVLREMLVRHLPELLHEATGTEPGGPDGDGSFVVTLVSEAGHVPLMKRVRVELDAVRQTKLWTRIGMRWYAEGGKAAFPVFQGAVELEPLDDHWCEIAVIGHYDPPFGPLGTFLDVIALHDAAQATVDWIATGLADALATALAGEPELPPREPHRLLVRHVMAVRPVLLEESMDVREAARRLLTARVEGAPVVDGDGQVVGVLSLKDLLDKVTPAPMGFGKKAREARRHHSAITVGEACSRPARTTEADSRLRDAAGVMVQEGIGRLVVLDGAKVVGMIDRADAVTGLIRRDEAIQNAIATTLASVDESVTATSADGIVTVTGTASTRSMADTIAMLLRDLDGVIGVDAGGLGWEFDDVTPPLGV